MAVVTFEIEELGKLGLEKSDIKEMVEKLGMSLEASDEKTVMIDVTPNRPDMLDIVGFARAALFLQGKKVPKEKFYAINNAPVLQVKVTSAVKKIRPFIAAAVIKNVNLKGERTKNLINFTEKFCDTYGRKRKKIAIGIYDMDGIKGPLTYDASKDGEFIPMGWREKATFKQIMEKHQKGLQYSDTIGKSRAYPFLRDANDDILSLIPITDSEKSKVTVESTNILVELTGTSKDAVERALDMIVCSFMDSEATIYPCEIVYPSSKTTTPKLPYNEIKVKRTTAEKTLGMYLEENKIVGLANKLGHVAAKYGKYTIVYVPPYRLDVLNEQDVIEDIAIAYGYDKIEPIPIQSISVGLPEESRIISNKLSRLMVGMGFSEAMNFYLTNEDLNFKSMGYKEDPETTIKVAYASTETITMLRTNLLSGLMQNLSNSTNERMPQRLFEIGKVFHLGKDGVEEKTNLGIVSEHSRGNFSEIKSTVAAILEFASIKNYTLEELKDKTFIEGRAAKIVISGKDVGWFGEINPEVLGNFKIEEPVVAAEINMDKLLKSKN